MRHQDEPGRREPHMNNANNLMLLFLHNHPSALLTLTRLRGMRSTQQIKMLNAAERKTSRKTFTQPPREPRPLATTTDLANSAPKEHEPDYTENQHRQPGRDGQ